MTSTEHPPFDPDPSDDVPGGVGSTVTGEEAPPPAAALPMLMAEALVRALFEALGGDPSRLVMILDALEESASAFGDHPFVKGLKAYWEARQQREAVDAEHILTEAWRHAEQAFKLAAEAKGAGLEDTTILAILDKFTAPVTELPPDPLKEIIDKLTSTTLASLLMPKSPCERAVPIPPIPSSYPPPPAPAPAPPGEVRLSDYDVASAYGTVGVSPGAVGAAPGWAQAAAASGAIPNIEVTVGKPGDDHIVGQCFCRPCVTLERQLRELARLPREEPVAPSTP